MIVKSNEDKIEKIAGHFSEIMKELGLDLNDPSLKDTPLRVAKMYVNETCRALSHEAPKLTIFPNDQKYDQMVVVKGITVTSLCEHHFQNIVGKCHVAYLPKNHLLGLSKFSRVVQHFAAKPQVQERLTQEIANFLVSNLKTKDVAVYLEAEHHCMKCRGVREDSSTTLTSYMGGLFRDGLRNEFLNAVK